MNDAPPSNPHPRGHAQVKALMPIKDVIARSKGRDPFLCGQPAQVLKAQWFAGLWQRFGYRTAHLRRIHYQLVVQPEAERRRHDDTPYENTERDWELLQEGSLAARYLGLVDPLAFEDHRNPPAILPLGWDEEGGSPNLDWLDNWFGWRLPTSTSQLANGISL
jgi:hypothetical protein